MERHLGFIHEEHIGQIILHQHRQQDDEQLFLTTRQLVRQQHFTNLRETEFILCTDDPLARL